MNQLDNNNIFENGSAKLSKEERLYQGLKKESKSVLGFFVKNYRVTYLIILVILALGIFSAFSLPRELDPEVKIPYAVVNTVYPGANPSDVEELITDKIEEKVKNLDNLKSYTSSSKQSVSSIFVEFEAEADLETSYQKLRDAIDEAKVNLPDDVEDPIVKEIRMDDFAIVTYSLVCDLPGCDLETLSPYVDYIQEELEGIKGVSKVEIIGNQEREFQIIVDQTKLNNFGISTGQLISAISRSNFNLPAGEIKIDGLEYNVRVEGRFEDIDRINQVVVATYQQTPIYVSDIAEVQDYYKEKDTESRIGFPKKESQSTISFDVYKKTGGNIIQIVETADELANQLQSDKLPEYIQIKKTSDNAFYIKDTLGTLGKSGLQTMLIIIVILFAVLGLRGSVITSLSVPLAFLTSFMVLYFTGQTLNQLVLFSLVIALGLMVDNSIIIMEGVNEYTTKHGKSPLEAALLSVWNFKWSVASGTLTTVAAFVPMLLVSGILGEYFAYIPITISATLLSSLFVALIVIPTLSSRFIKIKNGNGNGNGNGDIKTIKDQEQNPHKGKRKSKKVGKGYQIMSHIIDRVKNKYIRIMKSILPDRKKRRRVLVIAWACFMIAMSLPFSGLMKIEMFPASDVDRFLITVELAPGVSMEKTSHKTQEVEKIIMELPEIKNYVTSLGIKTSFMDSAKTGDHLASVLVNLVSEDKRDKRSYQITEEIKEELRTIKNAKIEIEEASAGPPSGAPIEVRIIGSDLAKLDDIAVKAKKVLVDIPGTLNVKDSLEETTGEFTFVVDKQKAAYYGLDVATVASALRTTIYGVKASEVTLNGDDIDITVKHDENNFTSLGDLENILIFSATGHKVLLKQIATVSLEPSLASINHRNGSRIVMVTSYIEPDANLQKILKQFNQEMNIDNLPSGYDISTGGEMEDIDQSFRETFMSMIMAVFLIAFILILQFNSFKQPLIILTSLPLAVIGVIAGLNLMGMSFSFPAFLGVVSLAGIGVNDAIVLIDRINKNMSYGMEKIEGVLEAGVARMQPIFLTSLTTIAGIIPLYFADEIWRGFSVTLIFGLIFSTILTLIVVPIMYVGLTKKETRN